MARAKPSFEMLAQAGSPHRLLSAEQCRALEPAIVDGTPLAGAVVTATAGGRGVGLHAISDPTGRYLLGLEAGTYDIAAEKAGTITAA